MRVSHLGHGVGLRDEHFDSIEKGTARADWFEVLSENFMIPGGRPLQMLERARSVAPVVLHGVSMNLGGTSPLDEEYMGQLDKLIRRYQPAWVSDHLCWSAVGSHYTHDLLPLPFTEEAIRHCVARIRQVQSRLGQRILIENISSYLTFRTSRMPEWIFLESIAEMANCGILLDINNLYVNAFNHGFDPLEYLRGLPRHRILQIHFAGHRSADQLLVDTHDQPVSDAVWDLYRAAVSMFGGVPTLIEWDDRLPSFETLAREADKARTIEREILYGCTVAA